VLLLAHAGHWLVNVAYFAPVVAFLVWLGGNELRERRSRRKAERRSAEEPRPPV
jgi:hypothetical protein